MRIPAIVILAAVVAAPAAAFAQGGGPVRAACQNDIRALCSSVQPGGGRIRDCMRQHRGELSAACKIAIADRMLERTGQRTGGGAATAPGITAIPAK